MHARNKRDTKVSNCVLPNCEVREKTNKMQQLDAYYQYFLNMFRASLCPSSGEQDVCDRTWCVVLVLLDVVGSGCGGLRCRMRALWRLLCVTSLSLCYQFITSSFLYLWVDSKLNTQYVGANTSVKEAAFFLVVDITSSSSSATF